MAEIIEKGPEGWTMEDRCGKCQSLIRYDENDLRHEKGWSDQREGTYPEKFRVKCPVCDQLKVIESSTIPELSKIKARLGKQVKRVAPLPGYAPLSVYDENQ